MVRMTKTRFQLSRGVSLRRDVKQGHGRADTRKFCIELRSSTLDRSDDQMGSDAVTGWDLRYR